MMVLRFKYMKCFIVVFWLYRKRMLRKVLWFCCCLDFDLVTIEWLFYVGFACCWDWLLCIYIFVVGQGRLMNNCSLILGKLSSKTLEILVGWDVLNFGVCYLEVPFLVEVVFEIVSLRWSLVDLFHDAFEMDLSRFVFRLPSYIYVAWVWSLC